MLSRALALLLALGAAGPALASRVHRASKSSLAPANKYPAIAMMHLTTHERFTLRPDAAGRFGSKQLRGWKRFLRCHHTGREHAMNPRLAQLIYATARHFGDGDVTVIAGYRAPRVARKKGNPRSPHKRGIACDFRVDGVDNDALRDWLRRSYNGIGVGFYPNSGFVHLDVGRSHNAFWIDYSGPGERASYSRDPDGDLDSGRVALRTRGAGGVDAPSDGDDAGDNLVFDEDPGLVGLVVPPPPPAAHPVP